MSFSLGTDVRCSKLRLDGLEDASETGGSANQLLTASGLGDCYWSNEGKLTNPLTEDLNQLNYNITGGGIFEGDGVEINNSGFDVLEVSSTDTGSLYKVKLDNGTINKLSFMRNLGTEIDFPTNQTNINYVSGLPVFGPINESRKEVIGSIPAGSVNNTTDLGARNILFNLDDMRYDCVNTRSNFNSVANEWEGFGLNPSLPGCEGTWGVDVAKGILKIEYELLCDFTGFNGNQFQITFSNDTIDPTTGTINLNNGAGTIYKVDTDVKTLRDSGVHYFNCYSLTNFKVGNAITIKFGPSSGSSNDAIQAVVRCKYWWFPVN